MKHKLLSFFLVSCMLITTAFAQERAISGRVTSSEGGPVENVSVRTGRVATQTDAQGQYTIQAAPGATLTFTAVGYGDVTATVGSSNTINIVMTPSTEEIDEVIVVGYGTVRRSDFTGSAMTVSAKQLDKRPITNPLVALQGAGPGVQTTTPGGGPGSSPGVLVRGIGSYSAGTGALYIVDGVEFTGGFGNINPEDVESITVLKDAATIAIFGSRGANGVVVVTTKKGGGDRARLDAKVQFGVNQNGDPGYDVASPAEYYELMWEAYKNSLHYTPSANTSVPLDIAAQIASGKLPRNAAGQQIWDGRQFGDIVQYLGNYNAFNVPNSELVDVNGKINPNATLRWAEDLKWLDQAAKNGRRNEYNVTFSNSINRRTDMYASLNFLDEEGWGMRSTMERFAGRMNVNSQIKDWLKAGVNLFANLNTYDNPASGSGINNPFYFSRGIAPIYPVHLWDPVTGEPVYDDLGNHRFDYGNNVASHGLSRPFNQGRHAIAESILNINRTSRDFVGARAYLDFKLLPSLTFSLSLAPEITNTRTESYENTEVGDGAPAGRYSQNWGRTFGYTLLQSLRYIESFGAHNLNVFAAHEAFSTNSTGISGMRTGQGFQNFLLYSNFTDIASLNSSLSERSMESYFSQLEYNFDSRYYLFGSVRYDGDSRFPVANRWSPFWSLGAAWRLEGENWFNVDWVNGLKLRASYGRLGNADVGTYPYQPGYAIGVNNASAPGTVLSALGSPDLRWEGQNPLTLGVDFSLFNHRLTGNFDYYRKTSDGLLFSVSQPYHNGGTTGGSFSVSKNVGDMENKGVELQLNGHIIRRDDFNWNMTFNFTTVHNKLLTLPEEYRANGLVSSPYKRMEGYSIYEFFTRKFHGVDPENGRVLYYGVNEGSYSPTNADIIVRGTDTLTYDHNIAKQDWLGKSALPKAYGSLANTLSYKNFELGFVLQYSVGGYAIDGQYAGYMSSGPSNGANLHRDLLNGWRNPGDVTDIPRMDLLKTAPFGATSDRFLERSDYLNLSAINVGYRLPGSVAARLGVNNLRLYASAENLGYITARKGFNTLSSFTGAAGNSSYSFARTVVFGINVGL